MTRSRSALVALTNGTTFPTASAGVVHAGTADISFRFLWYRTNVPSAPKLVKKTIPGIIVSQSCGLSNHQNNMNTPALNQRAPLINCSLHRWTIALNHAHKVKQKANQ